VGGSQLLVMHNGTVIDTVAKMRINNAEWHELSIEFVTGNVSVAFHHSNVSTETLSSTLLAADAAAMEIYFGSVAEDVDNYDSFVGCMRDIRVNSDWLTPSWLVANWNASANVSGSCEWSDNCEPDPCNRRGICTDLWTRFTCDCRSPFWGLTCSQGMWYFVLMFTLLMLGNSLNCAILHILDNIIYCVCLCSVLFLECYEFIYFGSYILVFTCATLC